MAKINWALPLNEGQKAKEYFFIVCITVNAANKKQLDRFRSFTLHDNLLLKGQQDDIRINISQSWERQYWATKFGITQKKLREMVKEVGCLVKDVSAHCGVHK